MSFLACSALAAGARPALRSRSTSSCSAAAAVRDEVRQRRHARQGGAATARLAPPRGGAARPGRWSGCSSSRSPSPPNACGCRRSGRRSSSSSTRRARWPPPTSKPTRIEAAKTAASEFARQPAGEASTWRWWPSTTSPRLVVPPTTDHEPVVTGVQACELGGATATGDSLVAALDAIKLAPADPANPNDPAPGAHRAALRRRRRRAVGLGERHRPVVHEAGVPVYTISFGTPYGRDLRGWGVRCRYPPTRPTMRLIATRHRRQVLLRHVARPAAGRVSRHRHLPSGYTFEKKEITSRFVGLRVARGPLRHGLLAGVLRPTALTPLGRRRRRRDTV